MKTSSYLSGMAIVVLAGLFGCDQNNDEVKIVAGEIMSVERVTAEGIWSEGEINYNETFEVVLKHISDNVGVKNIEVRVIDEFKTEYVFLVTGNGLTANTETIRVDYQVTKTGSHELIFFYQFEDQSPEKIGNQTFSINN